MYPSRKKMRSSSCKLSIAFLVITCSLWPSTTSAFSCPPVISKANCHRFRTMQKRKVTPAQPMKIISYRKKTYYKSLSTSQNSLSKTSTSLQSLPFSLPVDMDIYNVEDMIYQAQSTALQLTSASITSPSSSSSPTSLAILYFAGLLTSFSPCSLGLLPLTISYISNATGERDDKNVFLPTLFFAFGLACVFCGLGLSVAFLGGVFGSSSSVVGDGNGIGQIILALLSSGVSFVMGLQLLELVDLPLPSLDIGGFGGSGNNNGYDDDNENINCSNGVCSQIKYDETGQIVQLLDSSAIGTTTDITIVSMKNSNGINTLFRTFLLGGSSALVASPCATPVLTSILGFVAASRDPALGSILLLTYTVGYSTPLLIVGASGGQALAKAQAAASSADSDSLLAKIGLFVNPITASILIWYGTTGLLETLFGDPSMFALNPVLDYTY